MESAIVIVIIGGMVAALGMLAFAQMEMSRAIDAVDRMLDAVEAARAQREAADMGQALRDWANSQAFDQSQTFPRFQRKA